MNLGLDTNLVIVPMRSHAKELQYTVSGLPQLPPIDSCAKNSMFACWWEREVSVWQVSKERRNYNIMARIALKGEENICHASLSPSGDLLAIVTAGEFRLFSLNSNFQDGKDTLEVQKLLSTSEISGRLATFSPDGRWLAIITPLSDMQIIAVNEVITEGNLSSRRSLKRTNRNSSESGALGSYKRTINRILFSPNSRLLVATDLSGYVDTWILKDAEPAVNGNGHHAEDSSSSEDSDSEDSESYNAGDARWHLNPANKKIPKLDSAPITLAFRRDWAGFNSIDPDELFVLLVLTSQHHLYELDLHSGSLTEWSRRNPTSCLPKDFRDLKDRAMGSFWGTKGWWWIYGASWLFGINVLVDHKPEKVLDQKAEKNSAPNMELTTNKRKRKREFGVDGAGGKRHEVRGLVPIEDETDQRSRLNGTQPSNRIEMDEEEEGSKDVLVDGLRNEDDDDDEDTEDYEKKPTWFLTHKYRPILGIIPVRRLQNGVEVVLVERPVWDLNLPPRFEKIYAS
jgi:U3 small nucleolar RNA-associated protein 4